jgi:hypothetical protein
VLYICTRHPAGAVARLHSHGSQATMPRSPQVTVANVTSEGVGVLAHNWDEGLGCQRRRYTVTLVILHSYAPD